MTIGITITHNEPDNARPVEIAVYSGQPHSETPPVLNERRKLWQGDSTIIYIHGTQFFTVSELPSEAKPAPELSDEGEAA